MVDVLLSGQVTMSVKVAEFEKEFAKYVGAKYAVMVNSGSSANLLAMAVLSNTLRTKHFDNGDQVLVPAVCWSTSVWPIVQSGLVPVFVDVDPKTMNIDIDDMQRRITPRTKGIVAVHVLGSAAPMTEFLEVVRQNDLLLLEDTCEGLGVKYRGQFLGTFGDFGTYSLYFSHHMTTIEGGVVVCQTQEDVDLLKCLRAHGWTRELSDKEVVEAKYPDVDPRFLFVNQGYNLRPMETQGAMGLVQLERLATLNNCRKANDLKLREYITCHPRFQNQFSFPVAPASVEPVWFGFCIFLLDKFAKYRGAYVEYLRQNGVDNRPIISGNFVRQPGVRLCGILADPLEFPGSEVIHHSGLFVGLHPTNLGDAVLKELADILVSFPFPADA